MALSKDLFETKTSMIVAVVSLMNDGSAHEVLSLISPASFGASTSCKALLLDRKTREADPVCLTSLHTLFAEVRPPWLSC
jgi:hypothetical protein